MTTIAIDVHDRICQDLHQQIRKLIVENETLRVALEQPSREWRGLKKWEINDGLHKLPIEDVCSWSFRRGVYFAEAALKERNT